MTVFSLINRTQMAEMSPWGVECLFFPAYAKTPLLGTKTQVQRLSFD